MKLGDYTKNIVKVFSGSVISQAIYFITIPIIANIYGPSEYGLYATFFASVNILAILSTASFESTIVLPKKEKIANYLFDISYLVNFSTLLIFTLLIIITPLDILNTISKFNTDSKLIFYILPLSVFYFASFKILNNAIIRKKKFSALATNKVIRTMSFALMAICFSYYSNIAESLIFSLLLSHFFSNIFLIKSLKKRVRTFSYFSKKILKNLKYYANKFRKFPMFLLPSTFINVFCSYLPIFIFLWFFDSKSSGYFSFVVSILSIPISLLSSAILDVFKEKASSDYRDKGNCIKIYTETIKKMLIVAFIPFLILFFFNDYLINLFFSSEWYGAGIFITLLTPMFFFKFISSPLSFVFIITGNQKEDFYWHIYIFFSNIIVLYYGALYLSNIEYILTLYSLNYSIIYLIYIFRSYRLSKGKIFIT